MIPTEQMPEDLRWNAATLWAGPKCHIVHYPLSGWKVFNLVVTYHNDAPEPFAGKPVSEDEVMKGFTQVHRAPGRSFATARTGGSGCCATAIHRTLDRRPRRAARRRRASDAAIFRAGRLPGDGGRGVPVAYAGAHDDHAAALENYRAQRFARTARVQLMSRAIGEHIYHPDGDHARLRNAIMSAKTSEDYYRDLAWLYGGTGLEGSCRHSRLGESGSYLSQRGEGHTVSLRVGNWVLVAVARHPALCADLSRWERWNEGAAVAPLHLQHRLPVNLPRAGLRQLVDKLHLARIFVRQQFCL